MIRFATVSDLDTLFEMVLKECARYPLRPDQEKIANGLKEILELGRHFAMVAERGGKIEGALLAMTHNNLWAQRANCNVLFWVCPIPGEGADMLRRFRKWVYGRRTAIRVAGFAPDIDVDYRVWMLASRVGFMRYGGSYLLYT